MELLTGIKKTAGRFEAVGVNSSGVAFSVDCGSHLAKRGLPVTLNRHTLPDTDFSDWVPTDLRDYANAFGFKRTARDGHQAWAVEHSGRRYVVPALALIRAVCKPRHAFLGPLFRFQALEEMCEIRWDGQRAEIERGRGWQVQGEGPLAAALQRLSWFYCFPSARAMWSSVHAHACDGRLGLSLPLARAHVIFFGRNVGGTFYVTKMTIMAVHTDEEAFEFAGNQPKSFDFTWKLQSRLEICDRRPTTRAKGLLLREGLALLSDSEWNAVAPLFEHSIGVPPSISRRVLVDAVLQKQALGTSWRKTVYGPGVRYFHAERAYCSWLKDGRWQMLSDALNAMRAEDGDETSARVPAFADAAATRRNTRTEGLPLRNGDPRLSDFEWAALAPMFELKMGVEARIPRRTLVDAVLLKQGLGTSWRRTLYPEGVQEMHALNAHGTWVKDGRWEILVDGLKAMRVEHRGATAWQLPFRPEGFGAQTATKAEGLPLRDGASSLSDDEWAAVAPLFDGKQSKRRGWVSRRDLVDAVLLKQALGTAWDRTEYPAGIPHTNVAKAFSYWRRDGRWEKLLEALRTMRASIAA